MPRKPQNSKRRKIHDLSVEQIWVLIRRHDFLKTFTDDDHRREVWKKNRKFIMSLIGQAIRPEHFYSTLWQAGEIYYGFGERPDSWWRYEAKEQRRAIDGKPFDVPPGLYFGKPRFHDGCHYESQFEYLNRLDLLLPGELEKFDAEKCKLP